MKNFISRWSKKDEFVFDDPVKHHPGGVVEVNKRVISELVVQTLVPEVGIHPFNLDGLMMMVTAVVWTNPKVIFDWGTHIGKSALVFYRITRALNIETKIVSIDLPDSEEHAEHPGNQRGALVRDIDEIELLTGDGVTVALEKWKELDKPDSVLFFLDGDHEYETVKRELNSIFDVVTEPNVLVHDTFWQAKDSGYNTGPRRAVDEYVNVSKYDVYHTNFGLPGMSFISALRTR